MSHEIIIVKDLTKPYWENKDAIYFGSINDSQWESLFFEEFGFKTYLTHTSQGGTSESYDEYFTQQVSFLYKKYPLIARFLDFYESAAFTTNEIEGLIGEIETLRPTVMFENAGKLLDQLLGASEIARKSGAGFLTSPD